MQKQIYKLENFDAKMEIKMKNLEKWVQFLHSPYKN